MVNINRPPATAFGPPDSLDPPAPVYRCDRAPQLPLPIELMLNRNFPGWSFPHVSDDTCYGVKKSGGMEASAHLIQGDFNDDQRLDYAVLIQQGAEATETTDGRTYRPLVVHIVAFFRTYNGYQMYHVTSDAGDGIVLMRKGETDYDYEKQLEFIYPRDAIFTGWGMGGMTYLYEYGLFRAIITSD